MEENCGKTCECNKMKILSCCDNAYVSTGYGTTWTNLLKRFTKIKPDWEFYHLGWQDRGRERMTVDGFIHLPAGKLDKGLDKAFEYIMKIQPDYFVTMADVGIQAAYIDIVFKAKQMGWKGKWIAWTPIDSYSWAVGWDEIFDGPDINLAMANFGAERMKANNVQNIRVIPLGVDTKKYKPLENREKLRETYNFKDKFVVGFLGRNQKRKMVDRLIMAFAQFSKGKDDVSLLLHTDLVPPDCPGWDLRTLFHRVSKDYDPEFLSKKKINMSKKNMDICVRQSMAPDKIVEIYNLMDVFFYPTGGEGFGMPGIESQACGVPLIMTDATTGPELCDKHGTLIPRLKDKYDRDVIEIGQNAVENKYPDDIEASKILEKYYRLWKEGKLKEKGIKAREFSLNYDWDLLASRCIELFENENYQTNN